MKTKVLFRMFQGEVLALFPADAGSVGQPWTCSCYAHVGQHSAADLRGVMASSRKAKPAEYYDLECELKRIGYDLRIASRSSGWDRAERERQLAGKAKVGA